MPKLTAKTLKRLSLLFTIPLLFSCAGDDSSNGGGLHKPGKPIFKPRYQKDLNAFDLLVSQFAHNIEQIWGMSEVLIAGPKDYIKYSQDFNTRSHINFSSGTITFETISVPRAQEFLQRAIVSTLLMGDEINSNDLFSSENISESTEPFLFNQVLDETGKPIRWEWRANQFAKNLTETQLKRRRSGNHIISYVVVKLAPNHIDQRAHKFLPIVNEMSKKYGVDRALILSIMQIESSFNPYAVSRSSALGLMQIKQDTAGRDVFRVLGRSGDPSRDFLLDPRNNIDVGTAYLVLLRDKYLGGIVHPLSQHYAVITSYNGGAGSVLRTFSQDRNKAVEIINSMTPQQVYKTLISKHPSQESRNYLQKVNELHKKHTQS